MDDLTTIWKNQLSETNEENIELFIQGIKSRLNLMNNLFHNINNIDDILFNKERLNKMADRDLIALRKIDIEGIIKMHDQLINDQRAIREIIKRHADEKSNIRKKAQEVDGISEEVAIKLLKMVQQAKNIDNQKMSEPEEEK